MFVDALRSEADMRAFCAAVPHVPKMANMLEGGATPHCTPAQLQDMGCGSSAHRLPHARHATHRTRRAARSFKIVAYPLSLLGVSIAAMEAALATLREGRLPPPPALPSFARIQEVVGFNEYYAEEAQYKAEE